MTAMTTCPRCGAILGGTMLICPACGHRLTVTAQIVTMPPFAGFWRRSAACVIDTLILLPLTSLASHIIPVPSAIIILWLYYALLESSHWQATVGKRIMGLKVTDVNGVRLQFGRASGRLFAKFLSSAILGVGFFMAGWTQNKQCLHDMVSGCLVYRRAASVRS